MIYLVNSAGQYDNAIIFHSNYSGHSSTQMQSSFVRTAFLRQPEPHTPLQQQHSTSPGSYPFLDAF